MDRVPHNLKQVANRNGVPVCYVEIDLDSATETAIYLSLLQFQAVIKFVLGALSLCNWLHSGSSGDGKRTHANLLSALFEDTGISSRKVTWTALPKPPST
ncbi:hypothetical protein MRX96_019732 [Rhipicephalus microplus]